eukprot:1159589-Pelagomonas_calceolata.AAC.19
MVASARVHPKAVPTPIQDHPHPLRGSRIPPWPVFSASVCSVVSAPIQHRPSSLQRQPHPTPAVPSNLADATTSLHDLASMQATASLRDLSLTAENWKCVRQESFPDSSVNEFRHYRLADFSDNVNALPSPSNPCMWHQPAGHAQALACTCVVGRNARAPALC